jgi:fatty-acyl-CoA synthase
MFHANGWCFTWAITAAAGTRICLRKVTARDLRCDLPAWCGPLLRRPDRRGDVDGRPSGGPRAVAAARQVLTAGSPPPAAMLESITTMGFDVDHVFGIQRYPDSVSCARQDAWDDLPMQQKSRLQSRQGVRAAALEGLMVAEPETLQPVPRDGTTPGEILIRGNTVMKGYLKNPESTAKAFAGGWFHTGDIAVVHPDGYLQITDRQKDIIISGGENISSVEVEDVLHQHPAVLSAAVVASPDDKWGEVPCAFVELRTGPAHHRGRAGRVLPRTAPRFRTRGWCLHHPAQDSHRKVKKFAARDGGQS